MYDEQKRSDVQLLLSVGVTQERVANQLGVSVRTVQRLASALRELEAAAETAPAGTSPSAAAPAGPGRPSVLGEYRDSVAQLLAAGPRMKGLEVLRQLREHGYSGGKSAVYECVHSLRPRQVRGLAEHFEGFGGLPLLAVFDRPFTIVTKADRKSGEALEWNRTCAEVMARLGPAVELCWPYRANQQGAVENLVGWVQNSFLKVRRFVDGQDLRWQLAEWHEEVNEQRPSRATGRVPGELLRSEELPRQRPLKLRADALDLRFAVRVGPTGMVSFQSNRYSMPASALGYSASLHLYRERVLIVAGRGRAGAPVPAPLGQSRRAPA